MLPRKNLSTGLRAGSLPLLQTPEEGVKGGTRKEDKKDCGIKMKIGDAV